MAMEKGGCEIGKRESPKGGCKVGKKKRKIVIKKKTAPAPSTKKKITFKKKNGETVSFSASKSRVDKRVNATMASKTRVDKRVDARLNFRGAIRSVIAENKKKPPAPAPKKKRTIRVKKNPTPELTAITGLSKAQANAMSPAELFGMLPKELGQMVLLPSQRGGGVQVAKKPTPKLLEEWKKVGMFPLPEGIMKKIGKTFGRLPNLKGVRTESGKSTMGMSIAPQSKKLTNEEMYNRLVRKFGSKFDKALRENLQFRLAREMKRK